MRQNMFWNEEIETMPRQELEELQLKKLQAIVKRAFDKIPYYENPLWNRSWELLNIGFPNKYREFKLIFLQLSVKILEGLSAHNDEYNVQLEQYKQKLKQFHEHNYYND